VQTLTHVLESILGLITLLGGLALQALVAVETWLRTQLGLLGAPPPVQTAILIAVALILLLAAFRLFGGLIRVAVIIVVVLIAIHALMPVIQP
jgi:hypothetical protein